MSPSSSRSPKWRKGNDRRAIESASRHRSIERTRTASTMRSQRPSSAGRSPMGPLKLGHRVMPTPRPEESDSQRDGSERR
eukprot:8481278-Karenia_brevis.AAC.1